MKDNEVWEPAKILLDGLGLTQATPKMQEAFEAWLLESLKYVATN